MIKCPDTGKPLATGFGMDKQSFESPGMVLKDNQVGPCPHCGGSHVWSKEDAWLQERPDGVG